MREIRGLVRNVPGEVTFNVTGEVTRSWPGRLFSAEDGGAGGTAAREEVVCSP